MERTIFHNVPRIIVKLPRTTRLCIRKDERWIFGHRQHFHNSSIQRKVKPLILTDIGEGITECQIISWMIKPGDRVQQFDPICEVQSDKASVEITSRFDGSIKTLHYDVDDFAIVGKPLLDIDVEDEISEDQASSAEPDGPSEHPINMKEAEDMIMDDLQRSTGPEVPQKLEQSGDALKTPDTSKPRQSERKNAGHATPGVRHMLKELNLDITHVSGTGKDGRVSKEDIQRYITLRDETSNKLPAKDDADVVPTDELVSLTPIESQMFKVMTRSLTIPHFLYTHAVDCTTLSNLNKRFNNDKSLSSAFSTPGEPGIKLTALPFILKALSQAFIQFPRLNSHLDTDTDPKKPRVLHKASHNFGIAVDTPQGLLVPVIRDVQKRSIISLATEIRRLGKLAKDGALASGDFQGATFTISNIGSIGGLSVSPVIVAPMVGILGIGRVNTVRTLQKVDGDSAKVWEKEEVVLSWSADHRVLDGATVAKCAELVGMLLQNVDALGLVLR